GGVLLRRVAHPVGIAEVAPARVDGHAEALRVLLQQGLLPVGQARRVLLGIGCVDHEQRLVGRIRVGIGLAVGVVHALWRAEPLAGIRRNAAVGIAGALGADAGEVLAEAFDLGRRGLGPRQG